MKVEAVGHPVARSAAALAATVRSSKPENTKPQTLIEDTPDPTPVPTDAVPPETGKTDGDKSAGVLRLLEAGHFEGVADVRLRINFFEELSARASAAAAPAVRTDAAELIETMNTRINELVTPLATDEAAQAAVDELRGQFDAAVQTAAEQFASDEGVNKDSLVMAVQSAFDTFVQGLRDLLTPPPPPAEGEAPPEPPPVVDGGTPAEPPSTEVPPSAAEMPPVADSPTDPTAEPLPIGEGEAPAEPPATSPLDDALASLTTVFDELLSGLGDSIATALRLPDPSPPSGNGSAYEKFLAMYNSLRGMAPTVNEVG